MIEDTTKMIDREILAQYACEVLNLQEKLREMFKATGNPDLPPIFMKAKQIARDLEDLIDLLDGLLFWEDG